MRLLANGLDILRALDESHLAIDVTTKKVDVRNTSLRIELLKLLLLLPRAKALWTSYKSCMT